MATLNFTKNNTTGLYECTYNGESGALQVRMSADGGKMCIYGNAGVGYDILENGVIERKQFIHYLDMTGLNSVKLTCTIAVTSAVVNNK